MCLVSRLLSHLLTALHCKDRDGGSSVPSKGVLATGTAVITGKGTLRQFLGTAAMVPVGH